MKKNTGEGYYVMKYGGGRYTSVAWYPTKAEAQKEVDHIMMIGAWSGKEPKIEKHVEGGYGKKYVRNPARVISDKQALALTRKVIAAGKKLFLHEKGELRRKNPIEARHVQGFIKGIKEVEKYVVGSRPYIEALARAYTHLEKAKEEMKKTAA